MRMGNWRSVGKWILVGTFLFLLFASREWWLAGVARLWMAADEPEPADAIVVLGGGLQSRPFEAAELYRMGYAPLVLVMRNALRKTDAMGITVDDTTAAVKVLQAMQVPDSAIRVTDDFVFSTADEAAITAEWAKIHGWAMVLVPTNPFHTRRVRWLFRRALKGTECRVRTPIVLLETHAPTAWWKNEAGLVAFQNEVIKYAYSRLRAILGLPLTRRIAAGVTADGRPIAESE